MGGDLLEAFAALEAAFSDVAKRVQDDAWQLAETDVVDLTRRLHTMTCQAQGVQLRLVREVDSRSIPASLGATSLRAWISGAMRLSPREAKAMDKLARSLHEKCTDTGAALGNGGVNYEQAAAISRIIEGLPSKATYEATRWAEGFLLEHARVLNAEDLAKLSKRIDSAIDPDGTLDREKVANERRSANIRDKP
ncbi:DUF222 domain-containing protein [Sporichthya sp.]|uniref:DUF222 domain-containing protein n=1 Tax=Sporichthya sp. TaxID=65475 RepID=UPI0017B79AA4|nr:DUF222 domain-containing protein [Sporichthya sp.]MBA3741875.1 DUF222 domain-containing protein [Sporichthya sp.]